MQRIDPQAGQPSDLSQLLLDFIGRNAAVAECLVCVHAGQMLTRRKISPLALRSVAHRLLPRAATKGCDQSARTQSTLVLAALAVPVDVVSVVVWSVVSVETSMAMPP